MAWLTSNPRILIALALFGGSGFVALEFVTDGEKMTIAEFLLDSIEKTLVLVGAGGVFFLIGRMHRQHRDQLVLLQEIDIARSEGANWRRRAHAYVAGLGSEIDLQFGRWGLTEAEREVALLLLKGLSHKEVASFRDTAEATVRQQARSIYQKSGLPGKAAFSAFFLEDLLPEDRMRRPPDKTEESATLAAAETLSTHGGLAASAAKIERARGNAGARAFRLSNRD